MVKKKTAKTQAKQQTKDTKGSATSRVFDYFRFGESYTSLLLGMVIVILAIILVAALFRDRDFSGSPDQGKDISSTQTGPLEEPRAGATYTVKEGDTLWTISEAAYQNGFLWELVAEANNLVSPDDITVGTEITIPEIPTTPTIPAVSPTTTPESNVPQEGQKQEEISQGSTYTIRKGDTLWNISIRVYGDGYKWPQIAAHNNIPNPNLIYEGNTITFPRL